jgi:hypothetical protein
MAEKRNTCRIFVGKAEGKRPLGRPRRRWVDNIRINLREMEWDRMDWIDLAQCRALVKNGNNNLMEGTNEITATLTHIYRQGLLVRPGGMGHFLPPPSPQIQMHRDLYRSQSLLSKRLTQQQ